MLPVSPLRTITYQTTNLQTNMQIQQGETTLTPLCKEHNIMA